MLLNNKYMMFHRRLRSKLCLKSAPPIIEAHSTPNILPSAALASIYEFRTDPIKQGRQPLMRQPNHN
jgi:hypothetical protein